MRYNVKEMEERGIMGWLHSKGDVITLLLYIEAESQPQLRLPFKESFSAFWVSRTISSLSLAKCICTMQILSMRVFMALSFIF